MQAFRAVRSNEAEQASEDTMNKKWLIWTAYLVGGAALMIATAAGMADMRPALCSGAWEAYSSSDGRPRQVSLQEPADIPGQATHAILRGW